MATSGYVVRHGSCRVTVLGGGVSSGCKPVSHLPPEGGLNPIRHGPSYSFPTSQRYDNVMENCTDQTPNKPADDHSFEKSYANLMQRKGLRDPNLRNHISPYATTTYATPRAPKLALDGVPPKGGVTPLMRTAKNSGIPKKANSFIYDCHRGAFERLYDSP